MRAEDGKRTILVLSFIRIFQSISAAIMVIVYPYIILETLRLNVAILGIAYSIAAIFTALTSILFGYLTDRIGRKPALTLALSFLPLSPALLLLNISTVTALTAVILGGLGMLSARAEGGTGSMVNPAQNAIIADVTNKANRTFFMGLIDFLGNVSGSFALLLGGFLSYRSALLSSTLLGCVALLISLFIKSPKIRSKKAKLTHYKVVGKFSVTGMLDGFTQGLVMPFFIPYFILVYNVTKERMGIYAFLAASLATLSYLLAHRFEKLFGFIKSIVIARGMTILLITLFPLVRIFPLSVAIYVLYPPLRTLSVPTIKSAMMDMVSPEERGRMYGFHQASRMGVGSVGTMLASLLLVIPILTAPFHMYSLLMSLNLYLYSKFFKDYKIL